MSLELHIIEIIASILSATAAILMSFSTKENIVPLYRAFVLWNLSNILFLFLFTAEGMIAIAIQMIFFFYTSTKGMIKTSKNPTRDKKILLYTLVPYFIMFFTYIYTQGIQEIKFSITPIEIIASSLAIFGSNILSSENHKIRSYAMLMFITADILLAYIGFEHQMYAFMLQSMFFVFTSLRGYIGTMKEELGETFNLSKKQKKEI